MFCQVAGPSEIFSRIIWKFSVSKWIYPIVSQDFFNFLVTYQTRKYDDLVVGLSTLNDRAITAYGKVTLCA